MAKPKILYFDWECSNLNANWGSILCGGFKEEGTKKPFVLNNDEYSNSLIDDRKLCIALRNQLERADVVVSWYGKRFDVPFLNTRLVYWKERPIPARALVHIDGWVTAKNHLRLNSNRLQCVRDFLNLPSDKTKVAGDIWMKAISGDRKALVYIDEHCRFDVDVLQEAYHRIKPLIHNHPNMSVLENRANGCPTCGKPTLHAKGRIISGAKVYDRLLCSSCSSECRAKRSDQKVIWTGTGDGA